MEKTKGITKTFQDNPLQTISYIVAISVTLASVVISLINYLTANQLGPQIQQLNTIAEAQAKNDLKDTTDHPTFVTRTELKEQHEQLNDRLDRWEERFFGYVVSNK